jgi:hypothetical protein
MTIDEAREALARDDAPGVVYRPHGEHRPWAGPPEQGVITAVGHVWVFVCYGTPGSTPRATNPADLEMLAVKSAATEGTPDG